MSVLDRDHSAGITIGHLLQKFDGTIAEVTGVFDIEWDGRRAPQFVADVLALDRDILASLFKRVLDQPGQQAVQFRSVRRTWP